MVKQQLLFDLFCLFIIIVRNFLGFTIMLLLLNHLLATTLFFSNNLNNSLKSLFAAWIVLSSAKVAIFASFIKNNKSLINMLNNTGPRMDPRGTPVKSILNRPSVSFIFTLFSSCHIRVNKCYWIHRETINITFCNKQIVRHAFKHFREVDKYSSNNILSSRDFFHSLISFKRT